MLIEVHPQSTVPIYEQIVSQVIFGVAAGGLVPGSLIPSVRDLAQRLLVHPNTVAKAFQELERRGVVSARRGIGMEGSHAPRVRFCSRPEIALIELVRGAEREIARLGRTQSIDVRNEFRFQVWPFIAAYAIWA